MGETFHVEHKCDLQKCSTWNILYLLECTYKTAEGASSLGVRRNSRSGNLLWRVAGTVVLDGWQPRRFPFWDFGLAPHQEWARSRGSRLGRDQQKRSKVRSESIPGRSFRRPWFRPFPLQRVGSLNCAAARVARPAYDPINRAVRIAAIFSGIWNGCSFSPTTNFSMSSNISFEKSG
jgi:hypothetical protein